MDHSDVGQENLENMAEAAVERSPGGRFFCHMCTLEISPVLPDFVCPQCQSGFIEELAQGPPEPSEESDEEFDPLSQISGLYSMLNYAARRQNDFLREGPGYTTQDSRDSRYTSRPGPSRRARLYRPPGRRPGQDFDPRNRQEGFLQQLVSSLSDTGLVAANATFPVFLNLHSNPGDYAWGRGGWNAIITQLINQLDGTGPPPLPKDKIEEIPIVDISQEQVDKALQCTVCMEDFKQGEPVRKLSCEHHFHNECIIPWLELHGTCPICRKLLSDNQENMFQSQSNTLPEIISVRGTGEDESTLFSSQSGSTPINFADSSEHRPNNWNSATNEAPRGTTYNPHLPSVYDFTEEFD